MSLLWGRAESRAIRSDEMWAAWARGDAAPRTVESALSLVPLFAAHRFVIDKFAGTPWAAYRQNGATRERLATQPQLVTSPSPLGRSVHTWKSQLVASLLGRGNAVGLITDFAVTGWPSAVEWVNPDDVHVDDSDPWRPVWTYLGRHVDRSTIVHIPWIVQPGSWWGLSPLAAFRDAIATGHAAQRTARGWFENGAIPGGHFRNTQRKLTAGEASTAKERFRAAVANRGLLVTGADWDFKAIGVPADEARFVETLRLTATQIATIYGVPAEKIGGDPGSSLTYATREQNAIEAVRDAVAPWWERAEDAFSALLPRGQYVKANLDSHVRPDLMTRVTAHEIQLRTGLEVLDEARATEDKPPLTDQQRAEWMAAYGPASKAPTPPASREVQG